MCYAILNKYAWWGGSRWPGPSHIGEVGQKIPNDFGLYDMHGNVKEWCQDWWHEDYTDSPLDGSAYVTPPGISRVIRGGGYSKCAKYCRSANRSRWHPKYYDRDIGCRLVWTD